MVAEIDGTESKPLKSRWSCFEIASEI